MEYNILCPKCEQYKHKGECSTAYMNALHSKSRIKGIHRELKEAASLRCSWCNSKLPLDQSIVECECGRIISDRLEQRSKSVAV